MLRMGLLACIAVTAVISGSAQSAGDAQAPGADKPSPGIGTSSQTNGDPDVLKDEQPVANLSTRQKQIAANKAKLLRLATDLKTEIDKAGAGTLSVTAIRKANEIEKLARTVRQQMNRDLKQAP
jgi:hypothetical protein